MQAIFCGAYHTSAEVVIIPGSTATHSKMNVDAKFGQKMSPVWAYFTKFSPAVPSGPNQGSNVKCCPVRGDGTECPIHLQRHEGYHYRHLQKDHDTECKLVLAASNRSAQAKTQRAEALVEASGG